MPVDNGIYDRDGMTWWEEDNPLNFLHGSMTPGRFTYFIDVLHKKLGLDPALVHALDIGCGGGFLAEEFVRLGCEVVGVDPSTVSIETARRHAEAAHLSIDYRVGTGERLPVADNDFDVAYCCDVLEHVSDLKAVLAEASRALRPGGAFLFDTINRTPTSKLLAIKVMQQWRWTRIIDADLHDWDMFIKPSELAEALQEANFRVGEVVGLGPRTGKLRLLVNFIRANRGRITYGELSRRANAGQLSSLAVSYMGYAIKR